MPCSLAGRADCRPIFRGLLLGQVYAESIKSETDTRFVDSLAPAGSLEGPPLDQVGPLSEFAKNGWSQAIGPLQDVLSDTSAGLPPLALTGMSPGSLVNRIAPRSYLRVFGAGSQDASESIGRAKISELVT